MLQSNCREGVWVLVLSGKHDGQIVIRSKIAVVKICMRFCKMMLLLLTDEGVELYAPTLASELTKNLFDAWDSEGGVPSRLQVGFPNKKIRGSELWYWLRTAVALNGLCGYGFGHFGRLGKFFGPGHFRAQNFGRAGDLNPARLSATLLCPVEMSSRAN